MPGTTSAPELTVRAVALGLLLSVVMAAANVYLGLKAGMTVSASIPAAVVAALILRAAFRSANILEANQIQTAASAGESLAAGIIFTMPALVLIQVWERFDPVTTTLIAFAGGLLGVLLMIPMRRVFVVDNRELPYPEGLACAEVLKTADRDGGQSRGDAGAIVWGGALGGTIKLLVSLFGVLKGSLETTALSGGGRLVLLGADLSPALVGVGFIVRLNVAALIFGGGMLGWLVCMPLLPEIDALLASISPELSSPLSTTGSASDQAWTLWSSRVRYIGVGAMAVGGISSIVKARHGLLRALEEIRRRFSRQSPGSPLEAEADEDLSSRAIIGFSLAAFSLTATVYLLFTGSLVITAITTVTMLVLSFFFVAVSCYVVGLVGNSNNPVSGMTITAVLITGALLYMLGFSGTSGMVATLGVAAIVCCAACTSGDICNDLKTGSLVGASPRKQQMMQIAGVAVASVVMAPVLQLLHDAYTIGSKELSAPQASLFASLARGFFGDGELPWGMVLFGAVIGGVVLIADALLERRQSSFRAHLMPLAVGIYLPVGLSVPIFLGGLLAHMHQRSGPQRDLQRGILFSSGAIAGESLMGVVIALFVAGGVAAPLYQTAAAGPLAAIAALAVLALFWHRTRPS